MTERQVRIDLQARWKAAQEAFIKATGGEMFPSPDDFPQAFRDRKAAEASLTDEYNRRVADLRHKLQEPV